MRRFASVVGALVAVGWLVAGCAPKTPDIDVATAFDMGSVVKGEKAVADIPVRNVGSGPLKIVAVSTSCGCTTATVTPTVIAPGGEANLRVVYDSGAHEMDLGTIERYVFIASDDPDEEDVQINLTVVVTAPGSS